MNRFSSLEFDDNGDRPAGQGSGEPVRGSGFFLQQADQAFLYGDFELALRSYSRALEQSHTLPDAWAGQIRMLIELGEYPEAVVWADKALELFPDHPDMIALKAAAHLRDGQYDKALKLSDYSVSRENAGPRVWLARAEVMMKRKSRVAESCISKAILLADVSVHLIRFEAGRLLLRHGKCGAAYEYLSRAVQTFPKSALAWYELGRCQSRMGFSDAAASFERCLEIRPNWPAACRGQDRSYGQGLLARFCRRLFVR